MSTVRKNKNTDLVGQYFHKIENEKLTWQGLVIGKPEAGFYLVQLFEWLMGEPSIQRIVEIKEMSEWFFYDSADQMIFSWEKGSASKYSSRKETRP